MGLFSQGRWRLFDWFVLCAVVGIGLAIVVPNYMKAKSPRGYPRCVPNLKEIDGAVEQWALESKKTATDTYSFSDMTLLAYLKGNVLPQCPQGGRYSPGTNITDGPKCSYPGHTL